MIEKKECQVGQIIIIPKDTELNRGFHEDADFVTLKQDVRARIIEPQKNGAILVQLLDENDEEIGPPIYFHQHAN